MRRNISTRFHHINATNHLLEMIDRETARLQRRHGGIREFKIVVDVPNTRHRHGNTVRALVSVAVGKVNLVVSKEVDGMSEYENASVALDRAFDAAEHAVDRVNHTARHRGKTDIRRARLSARFPENQEQAPGQ